MFWMLGEPRLGPGPETAFGSQCHPSSASWADRQVGYAVHAQRTLGRGPGPAYHFPRFLGPLLNRRSWGSSACLGLLCFQEINKLLVTEG